VDIHGSGVVSPGVARGGRRIRIPEGSEKRLVNFFFLPRPKLLGGKSVSQLSYGLCAAVVGRHAEALNQMR
jgi:hypothetical protein